MEISCAFPTALASAQHAAVAEQLDYKRAWFYDNPPISPDVWMILGLAAEKTSRIGLGPGVLNPALRHPLLNAAGAAGLAALAPGRVAVGFGTGFGPVYGQRQLSWRYVEAYVSAFRGLLAGEAVLWEGAKLRMHHPPGHAPARPIEVPVIIAALGPKGNEVTHRLGDGLFTVAIVPPFAEEHAWVAKLSHGTVLEPDEDIDSERVRAAAGPGTMVNYHVAYPAREALSQLPGGEAWMEVIDRHPEDERHLAVHQGHFVELNEADEAAWQAGASRMVEQLTLTGTAQEVRARVEQLAAQGVTEVVYQPSGPDVERELERFMLAASGA